MSVYYNEINPFAAQWLRNLIKKNIIAHGDVDERSITEVKQDDLKNYKQCHFFAGIGGWPFALRLAGWPDDKAIWTGSCPCQPFSAAGFKGGFDDPRHLWPEWFRLIRECSPSTIFGEQVASKDGLTWLDLVSSDLESEDYSIGAVDLCAASVGAPHIRQRLFFVANSNGRDTSPERKQRSGQYGQQSEDSCAGERMADASHISVNGCRDSREARRSEPSDGSFMGDAYGLHGGRDSSGENKMVSRREALQQRDGKTNANDIGGSGKINYWSSAEWIECTDGKTRPVEPGTFPLAHGISGRVGKLRAFGNAIVPQVAAEFVIAFMEALASQKE